MNTQDAIEINPVEHSRARTDENARTDSKYFTYNDAQWQQQGQARPTYRVTPESASTRSANKPNAAAGVAKIVAGGACTLVGVPMLILPGPGLLAIGGGIALMASGAKTLFGK